MHCCKLSLCVHGGKHGYLSRCGPEQVRAVVPKINLDDVFIAKTEIAADVKETLTKSMSSFGFEIIQTLVRTSSAVCFLMHTFACQHSYFNSSVDCLPVNQALEH